jgi:uncharacterized protein (TIGR03435 family)
MTAAAIAHAQPTNPNLTFDVASVKPVDTSSGQPVLAVARKSATGALPPATGTPTRFTRRNAKLNSLLQLAYGLQPQQIIGPAWLDTERYNIEAVSAQGTTPQQQLVMLQNLLAERFQMKVHREKRELPIYEMVVAKGGSKLKEAATGPSGLPALRIGGGLQVGFKDGVSTLVLREHGTLAGLADRLSPHTDRHIVDGTGLTGDYDFVLRWSPPTALPTPEPAASGAASALDPGVTLAAALESQLGLKLVPKKGMVDVLVVDHAEQTPTEN